MKILKQTKLMKFNLKSIVMAAACGLMLTACGGSDSDDPTPPPTGGETGKLELNMPDKAGMNVKGVVYCGDKPLKDVVVSDGVNVVKTDANGYYYMNSKKERGYVFVSIPSGYTVEMEKGTYPKFYDRLIASVGTTEQINFKLTEKPGDSYVIMYLADMHLAGRNQDEQHYTNWFLKDINKLIADYKAAGKDVYCMTLGDQSWNTYWYATDIPAPFRITEMKPYLEKIDAPVFNTMGNHDHDPQEKTDFAGEQFWMREIGPTYYSYNIGDVHFIVLDNVIYTNPNGKLSDECYEYRLTTEQMNWLKADLATVADKSKPVHILGHVPMHKKPKLNASGTPDNKFQWLDGSDIATALSGFRNVKVFTGHTHINYSLTDAQNSSVFEYNVASVCATWWWTGKDLDVYPGNHICRDGSVGGYRVCEIQGKSMTSYYKSIGYDKSYQFRTYDCNSSQITAAKYCPKANDADLKTNIEAVTGASGAVNCEGSNWHIANNNNEVLINIFAYDPRWRIEVVENGQKLNAVRENGFDPLHIISAMCPRMQSGGKVSATFQPALASHFFRVKTSSPTSTLTIKVTDPDGVQYTETMTRPKALTTDMK